MRDVLADVDRLRRAGRRVAVARVVGLVGSGPRGPGATMAVSEDGEVTGSVSGGCVEGAVVAEALAVLEGDGTARRVSFGYSDGDAFAVGLTCGGTVELFIEAWPGPGVDAEEVHATLRDETRAGRPVALATVVGPGNVAGAKVVLTPSGETRGSLGGPDLDRVVVRDALGELEAGRSGAIRHYGLHGEARREDVAVFIESFAPPPRMVIFGAVDFTAALVRVAKLLGYRVTVCDARAVFATRRRFPLADEVVVDWPDRYLGGAGADLGPRDAVCVLTHDAKFDVPAIVGALATRVGYIGAMGSRRTHGERVERLLAAGVVPRELERVMSPIGLDLGSRTPEEVAISICAEMIARRTGHRPTSLRDAPGPVHAVR